MPLPLSIFAAIDWKWSSVLLSCSIRLVSCLPIESMFVFAVLHRRAHVGHRAAGVVGDLVELGGDLLDRLAGLAEARHRRLDVLAQLRVADERVGRLHQLPGLGDLRVDVLEELLLAELADGRGELDGELVELRREEREPLVVRGQLRAGRELALDLLADQQQVDVRRPAELADLADRAFKFAGSGGVRSTSPSMMTSLPSSVRSTCLTRPTITPR